MQDLKYGLRMIWKNPVFSAVAILTLALGIGANTAIYTVVEAVLLEPLPFDEPDELTLLWTKNEELNQDKGGVSPMDFDDWRTMNATFESMAAFATGVGAGTVTEVRCGALATINSARGAVSFQSPCWDGPGKNVADNSFASAPSIVAVHPTAPHDWNCGTSIVVAAEVAPAGSENS